MSFASQNGITWGYSKYLLASHVCLLGSIICYVFHLCMKCRSDRKPGGIQETGRFNLSFPGFPNPTFNLKTKIWQKVHQEWFLWHLKHCKHQDHQIFHGMDIIVPFLFWQSLKNPFLCWYSPLVKHFICRQLLMSLDFSAGNMWLAICKLSCTVKMGGIMFV